VNILSESNDDLEIIDNQDATNLEQSLIKMFRGYMMSEMAENDEKIERANLTDNFLFIQKMIRENQAQKISYICYLTFLFT
jgi:hypothetical protein